MQKDKVEIVFKQAKADAFNVNNGHRNLKVKKVNNRVNYKKRLS